MQYASTNSARVFPGPALARPPEEFESGTPETPQTTDAATFPSGTPVYRTTNDSEVV